MKNTSPGANSASDDREVAVRCRGAAPYPTDQVGQVERDHRQQQRERDDQGVAPCAASTRRCAPTPAQVAVGGVRATAAGSIAVASETVTIECGTITSRNALE